MGKTQDAIDRAVADVEKATTVEKSAVALIGAIIASARENAGDPSKLNAAMDAFEAQTDELSAAVVANTPADPEGGSTPPADSGSSDTPPAA
jgi:hypothetical protein